MRNRMMIVTAGIVAAGALSAPTSATAVGPAATYSDRDLLRASLRLSDVPARLSDDPSIERSVDSVPRRFEMCVDSDGHKVFGRKPAQRANATVTLYQEGSGNNITAVRVVSSDIYAYGSDRAGARAWRALQRDRERCVPVTQKKAPIAGVPVEVDVVQTQRPLRRHAGAPGWTLEQDVSTEVGDNASGLHVFVDGFTAYRFTGSTIIRVQFANYNQTSLASVTLRPAWRTYTRAMSGRIIDRLQATA